MRLKVNNDHSKILSFTKYELENRECSRRDTLLLTLDDCEDDVVIDELLPELANFLLFLDNLGLLRAFFLGQVLHISITEKLLLLLLSPYLFKLLLLVFL